MLPAAEIDPSPRLVEVRCLWTARILGLLASAIGVCVLAGWVLRLPALMTVLPGLVAMKPNTAICICLGGQSLFLLVQLKPDARRSRASFVLAGAMFLIGALTLIEYTTGRKIGIDEWLFQDPTISGAPGRMSPITSVNAVLLGLALVLLQFPRKTLAAQVLAAGAAFTSILAIVGYCYGVAALYEAGHFTAVALHTSVAMLFLSTGVWCARSRAGFMRVVTNAETSGRLVRRSAPAALAVPFLIGWLRVQGVRHGWYGPEMGVVIVAMANAVACVVLVWIGARFVRVAEHRQARIRQGLRESEERLQLVVENLTEGLVIWDLEGTLLHWNRAALLMHGFTTQEEGRRQLPDFTDIFEISTLAGKALPLEEWPVPLLISGRPLRDAEVRVRRRDRDWERVFRYGGALVEASNGQQLGFLTISDITLQKEAQNRFQEVANAMPQMVWTARADGFIDYYNERWYEYTGAQRNVFGDESWEDVPHPDDLPLIRKEWPASIATGKPFDMEFRLRRASDRQYRWFLTRGVPIKDAEGRVLRWISTSTDIHESKLLREENEQLLGSERAARTEAERTGRMKDEFLSTLSHELRTPLNAVLGWAQILRGIPGDAQEVARGIAVIERNARAQNAIIGDLLDMSSIISGKVRLEVTRLDLKPVLRAAMETVRLAAEAKKIQILTTLDPVPHLVHGDPSRLQQVFWNLLSNAIKFTPKGGRVEVVLEHTEAHVQISVSDSGEGIAPEFMPFVFDRFRQADASMSRQHGGLGLGLAIVKQLVELHGGSVRVTSPGEGGGTSFCVSFPVAVLPPEAAPASAQLQARKRSIAAAVSSERLKLAGIEVLVVDDEADARGLVKRLLEDRQATVRTAASAREALDAVRAQPPDILVSDIGMPGGDGYALIKQIRLLPAEQGGNIPAIALTAYARSDDRLKAMRAGFQTHLVKPVEAAELLGLVADLAGGKELLAGSGAAIRNLS